MTKFSAQHLTWRQRVISFLSRKLSHHHAYTIRYGLAAGMRRKGGLGFLPFDPGETPETRFLRALPLQGKVVYDIGAFEGLLTLFFASRAKQVIAYEPNPRNYELCLANVHLNDLRNVRAFNRGVADAAGSMELTFDPRFPAAGSADPAIAGQIDASAKRVRRLSIPVVPLDQEILENDFPPPDLVKIDVEGLELAVLCGLRRTLGEHHPALHIELHGATATEKTANVRAVVEFLHSYGYRIYAIEQAAYLDPAALGESPPSHIYCTA